MPKYTGIRPYDHLTPSFWKMFPDVENAEEKALRFLQMYFDNGRSLRAVGKELGYSKNTVKRIMDDVVDMPVAEQFLKKVRVNIVDFQDSKLQPTLFARYEQELTEVENEIAIEKAAIEESRKYDHKKGGSPSHLLNLRKLKMSILNKMLDVNVKFLTEDMKGKDNKSGEDSPMTDDQTLRNWAEKAYQETKFKQ